MRIMLIAYEHEILVAAGEVWATPLLTDIFVPASDLCSSVVRDSVSNIYYAARSLAQDERDEKLISIRKQGYRLLRMQENSSIASGFYSGTLKPNLSACQVDEMLRTICDTVSMVCLGVPPISFSSSGDCLTLADRSMLENALLNLLSNSIAYTRDGNEIAVSVARRLSNILITVTDKGAGIKSELLSQVTMPYFSANPYNDGSPRPGVGLGLTVAMAAAQLHGGSMVVTSEFSVGTAVTISIPAQSVGDSMELHQSKPADFIRDIFSPLYIHLSGVCDMA